MADCVSNAAELVEELREGASEDDSITFNYEYIEEIADAIEALLAENAKLTAERDAAVADLKKIGCCETCEQCTMQDGTDCWCAATNDWNEWSDTCPCWEWRGVPKEEEDVSKT